MNYFFGLKKRLINELTYWIYLQRLSDMAYLIVKSPPLR
jgi:hypothetical protein